MTNTLYALIIAGGRGERLRPLTDNLPKPMVPIDGRPLLSYQIERMVASGVTDVVFLCGYMGNIIREYFGDGSTAGFRAHYSLEETPLGRGGAIRKGMSLLPKDSETFVVANGDNITSQSINALLKRHEETGAIATVMLVPYPNSYGVVMTDDEGLVTRFSEKEPLPHWINSGIYIFSREIWPLLPEIGDHETKTFPALASKRRLAAYKSKEMWMTVDSQKDLREISEILSAL